MNYVIVSTSSVQFGAGQMKSKVTELGVFAIGVAVIAAALGLWLHVNDPTAERLSALEFAIVFIPHEIMVAVGVLLLLLRDKWLVWLTAVIVVGALVFNAISSLSPIAWVIAFIGTIMVLKTTGEAVKEAASEAEMDAPPNES